MEKIAMFHWDKYQKKAVLLPSSIRIDKGKYRLISARFATRNERKIYNDTFSEE